MRRMAGEVLALARALGPLAQDAPEPVQASA